MEERSNAVPRVSMDYHFMGKEDEGSKKNPMLTMVNEKTGDKYTRAVGRKGVGTEGEMDWIVKDISEELKAWGHAGGTGGRIVMKCVGEAGAEAVRSAVAKYHGGGATRGTGQGREPVKRDGGGGRENGVGTFAGV